MRNYTLNFKSPENYVCNQLSCKTLAVQANFLNIRFMGQKSQQKMPSLPPLVTATTLPPPVLWLQKFESEARVDKRKSAKNSSPLSLLSDQTNRSYSMDNSFRSETSLLESCCPNAAEDHYNGVALSIWIKVAHLYTASLSYKMPDL